MANLTLLVARAVIHLPGGTHGFQPGEYLAVPADQARELVAAGVAELAVPAPAAEFAAMNADAIAHPPQEPDPPAVPHSA